MKKYVSSVPAFILFACSLGASAGEGAGVAKAQKPPKESVSAETGLNCKDAQAIRDFKDAAMRRLVGSDRFGQKQAQHWAEVLCGKAAISAGFNIPLPPPPEALEVSPNCPVGWEVKKCAERSAKEYFSRYLPISYRQALRLGWDGWSKAPAATPVKRLKMKKMV